MTLYVAVKDKLHIGNVKFNDNAKFYTDRTLLLCLLWP